MSAGIRALSSALLSKLISASRFESALLPFIAEYFKLLKVGRICGALHPDVVISMSPGCGVVCVLASLIEKHCFTSWLTVALEASHVISY